jgi:hypothetical protein
VKERAAGRPENCPGNIGKNVFCTFFGFVGEQLVQFVNVDTVEILQLIVVKLMMARYRVL